VFHLPNPCSCQDPNTKANAKMTIDNQFAVQAAPTECPAIVHETVCVAAEVTIDPVITVGEIESFCVGGPIIGACPGTPSPTDSCTFVVSQNICVQVPLVFSATATAEPTGIVCGTPTIGPCIE
jgi:hypothetical protein